MSYTLGEAAKATGKSKAAISRAIKTHRISAERQDNGSFKIDPAELHRVYPPVASQQDTQPSSSTHDNRELREQLATLTAERERERAQLQDRIDDLRQRLDREGEERRQAQAQLTALLTDQREPGRRSWWRWGKQ